MEKYKAMFWGLLNGLLVGILFLVSLGFLTLTTDEAVGAIIAVVTAVGGAAIVALATIGAIGGVAAVIATTAIATAVTITAIVAIREDDILAGILFFITITILGIGSWTICRKFKEEKDTAMVTMLIIMAGIMLIGFIPAMNTAYVQLIPKDQEIIQSLSRKDLVFTLPMDEEKYLKEFFFLEQKNGNLIPFRDGEFEMERIIRRTTSLEGNIKNESMEIITVSFNKIDLTTIEGLIIQHIFAPQTVIPLEAIKQQ